MTNLSSLALSVVLLAGCDDAPAVSLTDDLAVELDGGGVDGGGSAPDLSESDGGFVATDGPQIIEDASTNDAATDAGTTINQIRCGNDVCDKNVGEVCCAQSAFNVMCATTCTASTLVCDGPEDCTMGNLCCGASFGTPQSTCKATCAGNEVRYCQSMADCTNQRCCPVASGRRICSNLMFPSCN